jgi:hypothetical protein
MLPTNSAIYRAGHWLVLKARQQQMRQGTQAAARNLRKQGLPLELALAILAPKEPTPGVRGPRGIPGPSAVRFVPAHEMGL